MFPWSIRRGNKPETNIETRNGHITPAFSCLLRVSNVESNSMGQLTLVTGRMNGRNQLAV